MSAVQEPDRSRVPAARWRWRCILAGLVIPGAAVLAICWLNETTAAPWTPKLWGIRIVRDPRPTFQLSAASPFRIEFGRGSGWHGLETVRIDSAGVVRLQRFVRQPLCNVMFEATTLHLDDALLRRLIDSVHRRGLMTMGRSYSNLGIADGTQWVLWIEQAPREKAIYFDNSFPGPIQAFAGDLDLLLNSAGLASANWQPVQAGRERDAARDLWASIDR